MKKQKKTSSPIAVTPEPIGQWSFQEAISKVFKEGVKVKRITWPEGFYLFNENDVLMLMNPNGSKNILALSSGDVTDDYIVL